MTSTNGHGPKRAILYARVSGEEQAKKGYSLPDQRQALREWAEDEGYEVLEEIADEGWSGTYLERPGLDRVRAWSRPAAWVWWQHYSEIV
jgi:DNA invertase Pin-like site-specific DNA recombinase